MEQVTIPTRAKAMENITLVKETGCFSAQEKSDLEKSFGVAYLDQKIEGLTPGQQKKIKTMSQTLMGIIDESLNKAESGKKNGKSVELNNSGIIRNQLNEIVCYQQTAREETTQAMETAKVKAAAEEAKWREAHPQEAAMKDRRLLNDKQAALKALEWNAGREMYAYHGKLEDLIKNLEKDGDQESRVFAQNLARLYKTDNGFKYNEAVGEHGIGARTQDYIERFLRHRTDARDTAEWMAPSPEEVAKMEKLDDQLEKIRKMDESDAKKAVLSAPITNEKRKLENRALEKEAALDFLKEADETLRAPLTMGSATPTGEVRQLIFDVRHAASHPFSVGYEEADGARQLIEDHIIPLLNDPNETSRQAGLHIFLQKAGAWRKNKYNGGVIPPQASDNLIKRIDLVLKSKMLVDSRVAS